MEARLALRTAEERARALAGRAEQLERAAETERQERARAVAREERRKRQIEAAKAVLRRRPVHPRRARGRPAGGRGGTGHGGRRARRARARTRHRPPPGAGAGRGAGPAHRRRPPRRGGPGRAADADRRAAEPQRRGARHRARGAGRRVRPGPAGAPVAARCRARPTTTGPSRRCPCRSSGPQQEKRLRAAERALQLLGTVNPLALEEFAALEERHRFLTTQLEDLKASRRDLLDIVKEVDERVEQVFTEAFHDTAREFEKVFERLFPGGEGRLVLTDPSDMLATGLDVEARPPGKKVKRLSLLSGGERSLTAVALLVAIFKARPSPFYVMDEVEAALDDTNLGRLITLFEELRETSQLIVITHQKRTMEVADALYGVTMRGDGVTTVISQRIREDQPA